MRVIKDINVLDVDNFSRAARKVINRCLGAGKGRELELLLYYAFNCDENVPELCVIDVYLVQHRCAIYERLGIKPEEESDD